MTLEELKSSDKLMLLPADIAPLLGVDPQSLRDQGQRDPKKLGFNVLVCGKCMKIPRLAFMQFLGVEQ